MSRVAFVALAVVATAGLLARSAAPVAACCICWPSTVEQNVAAADVIAIVTIVRFLPDSGFGSTPNAEVTVEQYLKGSGAGVLQVEAGMSTPCPALGLGSVGHRHVLFLGSADGYFGMSACGGSVRLSGPDVGPVTERYFQEVLAVANANSLPPGGGSQLAAGAAQTPHLLVLAGVAALAMSLLTAATLIARRTGP